MTAKQQTHTTIPVKAAYNDREGSVTVYTDGTLQVSAPPPTLRGNEHHVVILKLTGAQAAQLAAVLAKVQST